MFTTVVLHVREGVICNISYGGRKRGMSKTKLGEGQATPSSRPAGPSLRHRQNTMFPSSAGEGPLVDLTCSRRCPPLPSPTHSHTDTRPAALFPRWPAGGATISHSTVTKTVRRVDRDVLTGVTPFV